MPAARPASRRAVTNENDENAAGTTRLTRAKAAALTTDPKDTVTGVKKASIQARKAAAEEALGLNAKAQPRKRAALGDVSNVAKGDLAAGKPSSKDAKKPLAAKTATLSKAAQPSRVEKPSRTNSTRSVLGAKDKNANSSELKRPASGSGVSGNVQKKRNTSSGSAKTALEDDATENVDPNIQLKKKTTTVELDHIEVKTNASTKDIVQSKTVVEVEDDEEPSTADAVRDLDQEDMEDPLMVAEYVGEIFEYLRELEIKTMANPDYMDDQSELEWKMRGILVDWLLEVHTRFRLLPETLFLAVNIIDRFLSAKVVELDRLQLVGVTAMFIASKYEEVLSPHVQNFRHVADDGFTESEILSAERFVLATLNYDLSYPNPMNFLRRISKADNYNIQTRTLGKYLLEISCLDYRFLAHPPSQVAAASMFLARLVLDAGEWDATIAHYAGYTEEELQPVLNLMVDYLRAPVVHEAFFKKYASKKFMKASMVLRQWAKKHYPAGTEIGFIESYVAGTAPS